MFMLLFHKRKLVQIYTLKQSSVLCRISLFCCWVACALGRTSLDGTVISVFFIARKYSWNSRSWLKFARNDLLINITTVSLIHSSPGKPSHTQRGPKASIQKYDIAGESDRNNFTLMCRKVGFLYILELCHFRNLRGFCASVIPTSWERITDFTENFSTFPCSLWKVYTEISHWKVPLQHFTCVIQGSITWTGVGWVEINSSILKLYHLTIYSEQYLEAPTN